MTLTASSNDGFRRGTEVTLNDGRVGSVSGYDSATVVLVTVGHGPAQTTVRAERDAAVAPMFTTGQRVSHYSKPGIVNGTGAIVEPGEHSSLVRWDRDPSTMHRVPNANLRHAVAPAKKTLKNA